MNHITRAWRVLSMIAFLTGITICVPCVCAQEAPPACDAVIRAIASGNSDAAPLSQLENSIPCFWQVAPQFSAQNDKALSEALRAQAVLQKSSTTIQSGATSASNGTTSAVSKPSTPLASLATEYGGITSSTSNQTMTFQGTLAGIPSVLLSHGILPYCWSSVITIDHCIGERKLRNLNRFGFGVTANTSTSSQNVTGTAAPPQGTTQQVSLQNATNRAPTFSSVFARVTLIEGHDKLPEKGPKGSNLAGIQGQVGALMESLEPDVEQNYKAWQQCINTTFTKINLSQKNNAEKYFNTYYKQIVGIIFNGESANCSSNAPVITSFATPGAVQNQVPQTKLIDLVTRFMASTSIFEAQLDQMLSAAAAPVLSLEYDFNTPINQPSNSTVKLIGSKSFGKQLKCANGGSSSDSKSTQSSDATVAVNRYSTTLNVAGSFYNSNPSNVPGAGIFRSIQAGNEFDISFCSPTKNWIGSYLRNATLGFTYYYQDQVSPSILKVTPGQPLSGISIVGLAPSTTQVFSKKGPINVAQVKYGLGVGKNVKFPIAFSWSNRTELITHSIWSAQFGVSYDFSSLLGSKPASQAEPQ